MIKLIWCHRAQDYEQNSAPSLAGTLNRTPVGDLELQAGRWVRVLAGRRDRKHFDRKWPESRTGL